MKTKGWLINFRVNQEIKDKLERIAKEKKISKTDFFTEIIKNYNLNKEEK